MDLIFGVDWAKVLLPGTPILEIFFRGTVLYLFLFILLRFLVKREPGTIGISDLLVIVLLADASQNAMADDYVSLTDGLILVSTIVFWSYVLDWLGYKYPAIQHFVHPPALLLIKDGEVVQEHLKREFITKDELIGMLRLHGVEKISQVKEAYMEGDGQVSVVRKDKEESVAPKRKFD